MEELKASQKEKAIFVFLALCGLFLFTTGIVFLITDGITGVPFRMIGYAFLLCAFAASPKVMLRSVMDKSKVSSGKLSKIFLFIAVLNFIAALVIHHYKNA